MFIEHLLGIISVNPHKNHLGKYLWLFYIF